MKRAMNAALLTSILVFATIASPVEADLTLKGNEVPVEIVVPDGWAGQDVAEGSVDAIKVVAVNAKDTMGLMVLFEPAPQVGKLSLDDFAKRIRDQMESKVSDASHTDWKKVKVDGHEALRCELRGTADHVKLAYLLTVLKTDDSFDQVAIWSMQSDFEKSLVGFEKISDSFKETADDSPAKTLKGRDGKVELDMPAGWADKIKTSKNPGTQVLAECVRTGARAMVVTEGRRDLTFTLKEYGDKSADLILAKGSDTSRSSWESFKMDGHDAIRSELRQTKNGVRLVYVFSVVETPENFQQICAWTNESDFAAEEPALMKIADGFKELPAGK